MPIPTDTFWNIRRLNWVFAISAVLLVAVTGLAILQDYEKQWRKPQQSGRVWEAALVEEKIDRETTPEKQQRLELIEKQIAEQERTLQTGDAELERLRKEIADLESDRSKVTFSLNTTKAGLTVMESQLQDAVTADDARMAESLRERLKAPREQVRALVERVEQIKNQVAERRAELAERTKALAALQKERRDLVADREALRKKLESLRPPTLLAKVADEVRAAPLMQFINPRERVQQIVLPDVQTDVAFMKITTVDRCTTCHVNIANKDFTRPKVLAYLEEQVAAAQGFALPATASGKPADPSATLSAPGAAAMPAFWHAWARQLAPAAITKNAARLKTLAATVGKSAIVTFDGKPLSSFTYDPAKLLPTADADHAPTNADAHETDPDAVLVALIEAWARFGANGSTPSPAGHGATDVIVEIDPKVDEKTATAARSAALKYVEEIASAMRSQLDEEQVKLLEDRYRHAMVERVNAARRKQGYAPLDPSPALLAHPDLHLYVDVDSPHSLESVGCTSCHDGSGQETDFVLAAHSPRPIWVDQKTGEPVLPVQLQPKSAIQTHHGEDLSSMLAAIYPHDALAPDSADELHLPAGGDHAEGDDAHAPATHADAPATRPVATAHAVPQHPPEAVAPIPYVDPVTGRSGRAVSQLGHWRHVYEPRAPRGFELVYHEWDRPMLPPAYLQANCVRCHTDVYDIKEHAGKIYQGRSLFKNMGCVNCHQMDSIPQEIAPPPGIDPRLTTANGQRKVGTDLRHVAGKLSPAFVNSWVWAPKAFRPSTKMPHFFMLENNSSDEELRRTKQEARAITEYLFRTATPLETRHAVPTGLTGNADHGRTTFNSLGCLACHTNLNDPTGAKRDGQPVTVAEKWITQDLIKSGKLVRELEAQLGKAPDAKALTAEAQRRFDAMTYNERQLYVYENLGARGALDAAPTYPDKSPKPIFMTHGPELSAIGTKLLAGRTRDEAIRWLYDWLKEPRHYSAYTVMPRLRLSDQQAIDLVEYLLAQQRGDGWQAAITPADTQKLTELTAHFLRSRFSDRTALAKADEDAELTALAADALRSAFPDSDQAKQQAAAMSKDERRLVFLGKKLISHYGCMSCHAINGTEDLSSPCANLSDWGQKQVSKLDFGYLDHHKHVGPHALPATSKVPMVNGLSVEAANLASSTDAEGASKPVEVAWPHVGHARVDWITQKLKNSRVYDRGKALLEPQPRPTDLTEAGKPYDKLKMPTFYLRDEEVDAIVTFVISNRDRLISERLHTKALTPEAQRIARGRLVAEKYNCVNCHQIEHNAPAVQQYYKADELTTKAPPSLRGEGNKIQHDWLFNFLKNVEPLRPLPVIRMPSFAMEDSEATDLAAYFAAASVKESRQLQKLLDPVHKYIAEARKAAPPTTQPLSPTATWPGDNWISQPAFTSTAAALREWAITNKQMTEIQLDPARNKPEELARGYRTALFKATFTQRLYDAPYPFVESPRPEISDERFALGEQFFYEMQCLKCHVLGDPSQPGANKSPTAPNLSLAHRRLQRRWVRHWVQEPAIIQAGTAMPPFFTGLANFDLLGQVWPRSQGVAAEQAALVEQKYGDTVETQTNLLLDFLYAAGVRGHTGVQPAGAGAVATTPPVQERDPAAGVKPTPPPTPERPTDPGDASINSPAQPADGTRSEAASPTPAPMPKPPAQNPAKEIERGDPKPPSASPAPVSSGTASPAADIAVAGKVAFVGDAPQSEALPLDAACASLHADPPSDPTLIVNENHTLRNVVVYVSAGLPDGASYPRPQEPASLNQHGCMYEPHVLAMRVGQSLVVKNSDPFLHNVHSLASVNEAFNFAQPNVDPGKPAPTPKAAEQFKVKCDVHPWMSAHIAVFEHPFFAVTGDDGSFAIRDLPPGTYTLTARHEQLGEQSAEVTVEAGKPATATFNFSADGAGG